MSANFDLAELLRRKERQPWDERLPDGRSSVMGLGTESPTNTNSNFKIPALQRLKLGVPDGDAIELLKSSQSLPEAGRVSVDGLPDPIADVAPERPVRMGTDTSGMNDVQRQQAKIDLLRRSSPSSKIRENGDFIEEGPPEQSPSRVKNALLGALQGLAQGGVGGAIGLGTLGAIDPGAIQRLRRDQEIGRETNQLGQQLGVEQKQVEIDKDRAQVENLRMAPEIARQKAEQEAQYNNERLAIQREVEAGRMTRGEASRKEKELDRQQRELDRKSREKIAKERLIGSGEIKNVERESKRVAAQEEFDSLDAEEKNAKAEKDRLYAALKTIKENSAYPKEDLEQAQRDADAANKTYQSFAEKKREAQRRIRENTAGEPTTTSSSVVTKSSDGKYHYTMAQIQATIDPKTGKSASGKRLEEILSALRANPDAVIDDAP